MSFLPTPRTLSLSRNRLGMQGHNFQFASGSLVSATVLMVARAIVDHVSSHTLKVPSHADCT